MKIKVEIISEADDARNPEGAKRDVKVETHAHRGDMFNVERVESVLEGNSMVFMVPSGGRLVITTPGGQDDFVYDREQGAAVRVSQQMNNDGKADAVDMEQVAKDKQADADAAKARAKEAHDRAQASVRRDNEDAPGSEKATGSVSTPPASNTNPPPKQTVQQPTPGVVKPVGGPNPSNKS